MPSAISTHIDDLREPFRQSRLKFSAPGGLGLMAALEKPAIKKSLELHARVLRDRLSQAKPISEPKPVQVAQACNLTGRQLFEAMRDLMRKNQTQGRRHDTD